MTRVPDLSENSVLCLGLCDQKTTKNKTECWPFLWFLSYCLRPLGCPKIIKIWSKTDQKSVKMEVWGLLGQLLEAFGPQDGPKLKNHPKSDFEDPPQGPSLGTKIWEKMWFIWFLVVFLLFVFSIVFFIDFRWIQGLKLMPFRGARHAWSVVNSGRIEVLQFLRRGQFLMPPGTLPGSLFEVILAPSWHQVGSKAGF